MKTESETTDNTPITSNAIRNIGIGLILLSGVFFFTMLAVPFFSFSVGNKTLLVGILFVCVQVSWWVGAALVGPAAINKIKSWFSSRH